MTEQDDISMLPLDVREALEHLEYRAYRITDGAEEIGTIRAELLRLASAEDELAKLRARIADAPVATVRTATDYMGGITRTYMCHESQSIIVIPSLDGKTVHLVVEE